MHICTIHIYIYIYIYIYTHVESPTADGQLPRKFDPKEKLARNSPGRRATPQQDGQRPADVQLPRKTGNSPGCLRVVGLNNN